MSLTFAFSVYLPIMICLLIFTAFGNGSETAVTSCNVVRLKNLLIKNKGEYKGKTLKLITKFNESLTTILCFTTICNTGLATISTLFFTIILSNENLAAILTTVLIGFLVLSCGEVIPKIIAKKFAERWVILAAPLLFILIFLFYPLTKLVVLLKPNVKKPLATEKELIDIVKIIHRQGILEQNEQQLITSAIKFDEKKINSIITKLPQVVALGHDFTWANLRLVYLKSFHSRIPVWTKDKNDFLGFINFKRVFQAILTNKINQIPKLVKSIFKLKSNLPLDECLGLFQKHKLQIAAVYDAKTNNLKGIITLEDILEEIVGEIYDEYDVIKNGVQEVGHSNWIVSDEMKLKTLFTKYLKLEISQKDNDKIFREWLILQDINFFKEFKKIYYKNYSFEKITKPLNRHTKKNQCNYVEIKLIMAKVSDELDQITK